MTMDELMESIGDECGRTDRCREMCHQTAKILDDFEASSFDAVSAMSFMLGSAVESLAMDMEAPLDVVMEIAITLVRASAQVHANSSRSTDGMTPN